HCYFLAERDRNRRIQHLRCRDASSVPFRKDLNSILRVGDYGPLRLFDRTMITRLMAISEVIIPPTNSSSRFKDGPMTLAGSTVIFNEEVAFLPAWSVTVALTRYVPLVEGVQCRV